MREIQKSRIRYAFDCADGLQVRGYALYDARGNWLGDVALDYSAKRHCLRLYCVSDCGNYAYRWGRAGDRGYADFILGENNEYLTGKLAMGHGEDRILLPDRSREAVWRRFLEAHKGEDADWLGEAHEALMFCECEADFFAWEEEHDWEAVYMDFEYGWGGYLPGLCERLLPELKRMLRREMGK